MKQKGSGNIVHSFSYSGDKIEIFKELRLIAAREGKSQSELIVEILEEFVKNHAEGNDTFKLDNWQEDPEFIALPTLLSPKDKWNNFVKDCSDDDCVKIASMAKFIHECVSIRRTHEWKQRQKNKK